MGSQFHELDRIDNVVSEAQNRMQTHLDSFENFIQKKKNVVTKSAEAGAAFNKEDVIFEESHN